MAKSSRLFSKLSYLSILCNFELMFVIVNICSTLLYKNVCIFGAKVKRSQFLDDLSLKCFETLYQFFR